MVVEGNVPPPSARIRARVGGGVRRLLPNILLTGTPGVGKSVLREELVLCCAEPAAVLMMRGLDVGELIKSEVLYDEWDDEMACSVFDENKVMEAIEKMMGCPSSSSLSEKGGWVVDFHSCWFFPSDWFDLVLLIRTDTDILFDRLVARHYVDRKVQENVQCEIFGVVLEEAIRNFESQQEEQSSWLSSPSMIWVRKNNTVEQMEETVLSLLRWIEDWKEVRRNESRPTMLTSN